VPLLLPDADSPNSPPLPGSEPALDETWVKLCEEGTGRAFYYNVVSQTRQWEVPLGYQVGEWEGGRGGKREGREATLFFLCPRDSLPLSPLFSLQPRLPAPCERDGRMLRHYFDLSTLPGNREDAKKKEEGTRRGKALKVQCGESKRSDEKGGRGHREEERGLDQGLREGGRQSPGLSPTGPASRGPPPSHRACISADRDWRQHQTTKTLEKHSKTLEWLRKE
ncbi:hypothetical protein NGA_0714320, partial [Nannochloropsis gaditana CCMP526]